MRNPKKEVKILVPETLRRLDIGESISFTRTEVDSRAVCTAASRIKRKEGKQFSTHLAGDMIVVTRKENVNPQEK